MGTGLSGNISQMISSFYEIDAKFQTSEIILKHDAQSKHEPEEITRIAEMLRYMRIGDGITTFVFG
jgi:hypothetical protein